MRIVIDLQGAQSASRYRGIGRYSVAISKAIVKNSGNHEVIIALSNLFADTIDEIKQEFKEILPLKNIKVWHGVAPVKESEEQNYKRREISELLRESFLSSLKPDIIFITSLFEGYVDNAVTSIKKYDKHTKVAVTSHDLIPYIHQDKYLSNRLYKEHYLQKIEYLKQADLILGISESSCREVVEHLGISREKVVNTSEAVDESFRPKELTKEEKSTLYKRFNIIRKTIVYAPGGFDVRKNFENLIEAYSILPKHIKENYQLVIISKVEQADKKRLLEFAKSKGVKQDDLIFTGYVLDNELISFYTLCDLFVFPSIHEGFGLPLLEAMSCGAVVIGSNTTSIPEVIGCNEALFDPYDVNSISSKIAEVIENKALQQKLLEHNKSQIKKFSWDNSAKKAIQSFETMFEKTLQTKSWKEKFQSYKKNYNRQLEQIAKLCNLYKLDEEELYAISKAIAKNDEVADEILRETPLPQKITWRVEGPFDSSYSLALLNRETALALDELGHDVILHSTEGPGDFDPSQEFLDNNPKLNQLYQKSLNSSYKSAEVTSRNLYPPRVDDMTSQLNLLHHYAWEESGFPMKWIENFNQHLQGITCLSKHVEKILIDNGVTVPLTTSGCGVDHWEKIIPETNYKLEDSNFHFLHVSSCFPRKGVDVLLKAYGKAFSSIDKVTLVIKTFSNPHNQVHEWLKEAKKSNSNYPKVVIIEEDLSQEQLKALYNQCDVLVAPSRAEGFGLPLAEAMLSNLAVIATGWGGQLDFCNDETAWLIDYKFLPAQTHFELFDSAWAEPSIEHLALLMQQVWQLPKEKRLKKTKKAKEQLLKSFKWRDIASNLVDATREFSKKSYTKSPKIGWVTTWNTKCGIATYSEHLINNMYEPVSVLASQTNNQTAQDKSNVYRCWRQGEEDNLIELSKTIEQLNLDTIVIQFNYGFFNFEHFKEFLEEQTKKERVVVITLHSTNNPKHAPNKKLEYLVEHFAKSSRILVHTYNDLNRLKNLNLIDNVTLFPHGLVDWNEQVTPTSNTTFTIASYGFFLPHKGLLELIEAFSFLIKRDIKVKLKMVNALYPVPESQTIVSQAKELIESLKLSNYIELHTDFLPDQESLTLLSQADLIVFPYQETGESSSAAVRYGLATKKPVAVTPLAIFDDVQKAVFSLPGTSAQDLADGIEELMVNIKQNSKLIQNRQQDAKKWRKSHSYSHLGSKLTNILIALKKQKLLTNP